MLEKVLGQLAEGRLFAAKDSAAIHVNVHFWHLADLYAETEQVPSWAQTRRGLAKAQGSLLTLS